MIFGTPKATFISCLVSLGVHLLKNKAVLFLLTFCPDASSYIFKISNTLSHSSIVALQKRRLSYAKSRWVSLGPLLHCEKPCISLLFSALLISPFRRSIQSSKRKGDSESPCLIPRVGQIIPQGSLFTNTEYDTVFTHPIINWIHPSLKSICLINFSKKPQSLSHG